MSSFFTAPGKRKRQTSAADGQRKRLAATYANSNSKSDNSNFNSNSGSRPAGNNANKKQRVERDESISGSDSEDDDGPGDEEEEEEFNGLSEESESEGEGETAAERRLRLAERYLDNVKQEVDEVYGFDAEDVDRDLIAERMQEDVAENKGKVYRSLAGELQFERASHTMFRWNSQNVTSIATCAPYAYTVSRDMFLVKWKLQDLPQYQWPQTTKKKPKKPPAPPKKKPQRIASSRGDTRKSKDKTYQGHTGPILKVAASQDGRFVVTAGADRRIVVHDAETLKPIRAFSQHRDAVTGLAFRRGTNQLYSSSKDRTVKVWSLNELAYVETLFGHQDHVVDVDALAHERCVSVGARDRTARLWKVVEETQLVFRGGGPGSSEKKKKGDKPAEATTTPTIDPGSNAHEGSMDRVSMLDEELFVTGSDNGSIALWSTQKKKPLFVLPRAHGVEPALTLERASGEKDPDPTVIPPPQPRWITALRTIPYSDIILSGSWDGYVRVWKLSEDKRRIERVGVLGATEDQDGNVVSVNPQHQFPQEGAEATANGTASPSPERDEDGNKGKSPSPTPDSALGMVKGVINDISVFERGDRGRDGLCVVIALGKEHRLGRWKKLQGGRNGAMVFEVPRLQQKKAVAVAAAAAAAEAVLTNGVEHAAPAAADGEKASAAEP